MIGIIYTGESKDQLMREWQACIGDISKHFDNLKVFVEPCMEEIFIKNMNILDRSFLLPKKGFNPFYNGIKITNSKKENEKRNPVTLTIKQIADKFGVSVENLRIKE